MKHILILFFGLIFFYPSLFAQEQTVSIQNIDKKIKDSFTLIDGQTENYYLFLKTRNKYKCYLYTKEHELINTLEHKELDWGRSNFLGYSVIKNKITLLMYSEFSGELGSLVFDFENSKTKALNHDFRFKRQLVIDSFVIENKIHVYTISKKKNEILAYIFEGSNSKPEEIVIPFKKNQIKDRKDRSIKIHTLLTEKNSGIYKINSEFIENDVPNSLEKTSKTVKTYKSKNELIISSDKFDEFTYIIKINIKDTEVKTLKIPQGILDGSRLGLKTNSFYFDKNLYQISVNKNQLKIRMSNGVTGDLIKEYNTFKTEDINYKNTPIFKSGDKSEIYSQTSRFLRDISEKQVGITAYKLNEITQITFGAFIKKDIPSKIAIGASVGGFGGSFTITTINTISSSFAGYNNTNASRATGLFDESFKHLEGEVQKNKFDTIKQYLTDKKDVDIVNIFSMSDSFHLGIYSKDNSSYTILKF